MPFTQRHEPDGTFLVGCDLDGRNPDYDGMAQALIDQAARWRGFPMTGDKPRVCAGILADAFRWFGDGSVHGDYRYSWGRVSTAGGSAFLARVGPLPRSAPISSPIPS